jgi:maltose alpha-D-glucosyltransferase/alpha-amylase
VIEDLWYKNAVIYCLDVETFHDGNGDGIGDFRGLKRRIDYLAGLGVTCLWLLPFFPTPNRDNGYDISDYYGVDPRLGDLGDFVAFSHYARARGMRVIVDLVVNHTSDQHPWFKAARADPESPYRDYYVWSKKKPKDHDKGMVFPGVQRSTWTRDAQAGAYYFHRFYEHQPDLNVTNPAVREEIFKIMGYWLELGASGFRVDALPFLLEHKGATDREGRDEFDLLDEMRDFLSWRQGDAILIAEANVPMKTVKDYFGHGDRVQMVFNFQVNQQFFGAMVTGDARPVAEALRAAPPMHDAAQWANFLRNHDELDLGRLDRRLRERVFAAMGPEPRMQLYDRGLRRRLAPLLDGDPRKLSFAYSLMFSLPGTPVLWYGDEIGMGERLSLKERQAVRTPMQWSDEHQGGFTTAEEPIKPLVDSGPFSYQLINVARQRNDPDSLLSRVERMIRMRKESPELGWGRGEVLTTGNPSVLALRSSWRKSSLVTVHNFASAPGTAKLRVFEDPRECQPLFDVFSEECFLPDERGRYSLSLPAYGYHWLRTGTHDSVEQRSRLG